MLELNEKALDLVSGGYGSSKRVSVNANTLVISADRDVVTKGGSIVFSINQFNGQQNNEATE